MIDERILCFIHLSKNLTKTCRGKVMKEMLNCVKLNSSLIILHSSFYHRLGFSLPYLTFDRAKGYVSSPQTYPLARLNDTFSAPKRYLWQK